MEPEKEIESVKEQDIATKKEDETATFQEEDSDTDSIWGTEPAANAEAETDSESEEEERPRKGPDWPPGVPMLDSWKVLSRSHRREAFFTIWKVRSYIDFFRWMVIEDSIMDRDIRMGVLKDVKFLRKLYLAALRHAGLHDRAEEAEAGEQFDGWDDEVFAMPDPLDWEALAEDHQNKILGYINGTTCKDYKILEKILVEDKPVPDFENVMLYARFMKLIYLGCNIARDAAVVRPFDVMDDFSYTMSPYTEKFTLQPDPNREGFAENRAAWSKIMDGNY